MSAVGWRTRQAWLDYRLNGQTKSKAALSAGCWSTFFCLLLIIFPWVWAALEERNDYPEVIALKIAASSILGLRLALSIFRVPSDECFGKERILTVSKLYIAVIAVTFLAQLPVMVLYMVKTTQYHLDVTIVIGIAESFLLASELYLIYRLYSFVQDPEGWAIKPQPSTTATATGTARQGQHQGDMSPQSENPGPATNPTQFDASQANGTHHHNGFDP